MHRYKQFHLEMLSKKLPDVLESILIWGLVDFDLLMLIFFLRFIPTIFEHIVEF